MVGINGWIIGKRIMAKAELLVIVPPGINSFGLVRKETTCFYLTVDSDKVKREQAGAKRSGYKIARVKYDKSYN